MTKAVYILSFLIISSLSIYGQTKFSIVANPQIAWMKPDVKAVKTDGVKFGFSFGLNMDFYFAENYALSFGALLLNTGGNLLYNSTNNDSIAFFYLSKAHNVPSGSSLRYDMKYLEFPVGFKFKTDPFGSLTFYAQTGFNAYFRLTATGTTNNNDYIDHERFTDEVRGMFLGYHIGGGVEYQLSENTVFTGGIIFNNGFTDITTNDAKRKEDRVVLNGLNFRLGIIF